MANLAVSLLKAIVWVSESTIQVSRGVIKSEAGGRADQRFAVAMRYFTWKKLFNLVRIEIQLRLGRQKVWGLPYEWEIDTTNLCQLQCPLCHTGLGTIHRDKGTMHYDLFTKTVDQIKDYCIWLTLYNWGEPFLNRRIHEFVSYAHQKEIATLMSTNLNKPLTPQMAEDIIKSGLDVLILSIDGVTQEVYQVYRVGGQLDRVLNNLKLLVQKKRELGYQTPYLEWQFIVMRQNEHQIPAARKLAAELGVDTIVFKKVDFPHGEDDPAFAKRWLPRNHPEYLRSEPFNKPYQEDGERCWRLWRSGVVNWDGGYAPCCYLTDKSDDFGDVNTTSIREIWNNEHYITARGLFQEDYLPKKQVGCLSCSVYLGSRAARKRGPLLAQIEPVKAAHGLPKSEARASNSVGDGFNPDPAQAMPAAVEKSEKPGES